MEASGNTRTEHPGVRLHQPDFQQSTIQQVLLGKLNTCLQKTETRSMFVTLYKYQLKVDEGPYSKT
jgi:hypothetical protein